MAGERVCAMTVSFAAIELARKRLRGITKPTPLVPSATLDAMLKGRVLIKPENLQKTGSFKIRGAFNRIAAMSRAERARGVVAASAGNHGQALAYAATCAGVKATIVMPATAAMAKISATRGYGQEVVLEGADYMQARLAADAICRRTGALFVDAFDDPLVVAGQGTVGVEIIEESKPDAVIIPVGGGGLLAGVAVAMGELAPAAEVIGVEAAGSPQLSLSLAANAPVTVERPVDTIADGLATGRLGRIPFETIAGRVKRVVTVDDFEIGEAVLLLLERLKLLAEGAGAAALAGALKIRDELRGKTVAVVVSGGNIDINLLDRIIEHGLSKMGRLFRFAVGMHDRPGELGKLLQAIGETGANVRTIGHDRTRRDVPVGRARVQLEIETRGPDHIEAVRAHLGARGYVITDDSGG
jgi:threonine dehydratase